MGVGLGLLPPTNQRIQMLSLFTTTSRSQNLEVEMLAKQMGSASMFGFLAAQFEFMVAL